MICATSFRPPGEKNISSISLFSPPSMLLETTLSLSLSHSQTTTMMDGGRGRWADLDGSFEDLGTRVADETNGEHPADYARNDRAN